MRDVVCTINHGPAGGGGERPPGQIRHGRAGREARGYRRSRPGSAHTTRRKAMPAREELPSTLRRSPKKAQETWGAAHDAAVEQYGEGERAHRTAFAALKHGFEKVGDHWEPKPEKGPSDPQAAKSGAPARRGGETSAGVDANASKQHLYEI